MPSLAAQISQILNRNFNHERSLNKPLVHCKAGFFGLSFCLPLFKVTHLGLLKKIFQKAERQITQRGGNLHHIDS